MSDPNTVRQEKSYHFAAEGVQCGFFEREGPLTRALPPHMGFGNIALEHSRCRSDSKALRSALEGLPGLCDPMAHDVRRVVLTPDMMCGAAYNAKRDGFRFCWRKLPNSVGVLSRSDDPSAGVEEQGVFVSYGELQRYLREGHVDMRHYDVVDQAKDLPNVFVRLKRVEANNSALVSMVEDLMIAHAHEKLRVHACCCQGEWSEVVTTVQAKVKSKWRRHDNKAHTLSLFTAVSRSGLRNMFEMTLRKHVLLYEAMRSAKVSLQAKDRALLAVGPHEIARLWDAHASANIACMVRVLSKVPNENTSRHESEKAEPKQGTLRVNRRGAGTSVWTPVRLMWREMNFDQRKVAQSAMVRDLDWKTFGPKLPEKMTWSSLSDRFGAKKCSWEALSVPQVRLCNSKSVWYEETGRATNMCGTRVLVTDTLPTRELDFYHGVLYVGSGGLCPETQDLVHWEDKKVKFKVVENGTVVKRKETWVFVDWKHAGDNVRVVCEKMTAPECQKAALLVRLFPLVPVRRQSIRKTQMHPSIVSCVKEHIQRCQYWLDQYDDDELDRDELRAKNKLDRMLDEYSALLQFVYPGCNVGADFSVHSRKWLQ